MELLKVEHLSKVYGKGENEVKALDDVSFLVQQGEFVAIIGPSGSYFGRGGSADLGACVSGWEGYL